MSKPNDWTWGWTHHLKTLSAHKSQKLQSMLRKSTSECKILIVFEEGVFGQPKYSTPSKRVILRCVDYFFYISHYLKSEG